VTFAEHLAQRARLLADRGPHGDVGYGAPGFQHAPTVTAVPSDDSCRYRLCASVVRV